MTPVYLAAICDASAPICPKCGKPIVGRFTVRPGGALGTCMYRVPSSHQAGAKACGQKVVILDNSGGMCTVVGVERRDFDSILGDIRPLRDVLGDLGVIAKPSLN